MSLYIRVQLSFWKHRKTLRLRALIGDAAYLVPLRLWSYAAENQPDGNFSDYSAEELAMLVAYQGDAQAMLQALQQAGWLDDMRIHDWEEHNAYHAVFSERAKVAAAARWDREKEKKQKKESTRKEKKGKETSIATSMLEAFPNGFSVEWEHFKEHRRIKKAPMTRHAEELILRTLQERPSEAKQAIEMAVVRNWTGFQWDWYDGSKVSADHPARPRFLSFEDRKKRKGEIQEELNAQFRGKGSREFTEEEEARRDKLREEMETL